MESKAIVKAALIRNRPKVIALGGGAFEMSRNRKIVSPNGISVWLRCSVKALHKRLKNKTNRPLLKIKSEPDAFDPNALINRLKSLLEKRQTNYKTADIYVSTSRKTPREISSEIIKLVSSKYAAH
jgi:shikimate kinase